MCNITHVFEGHDAFTYVWHDAFICATWRIHFCNMAHSYVRHDAFICATWRIHMCDMTHSCVWHDSFICVPWRISLGHGAFMCVTWRIFLRHDTFICVLWRILLMHAAPICVTWCIRMCDTTHSYVYHDTFTRLKMTHSCVCYDVFLWDMMHSYAWHDAFVCLTWRFHMCDMTHSYVTHDAFLWDMRRRYGPTTRHMYECVMAHVWMSYKCAMTHLPSRTAVCCSVRYARQIALFQKSCVCSFPHTESCAHALSFSHGVRFVKLLYTVKSRLFRDVPHDTILRHHLKTPS